MAERSIIERIIRIGKVTDAKIPIRRFPPATSETSPATVGPVVHPTSPARESRANIAVVPPRILDVARVKVQGQKIPTVKPQRMQPIKPTLGEFDSDSARKQPRVSRAQIKSAAFCGNLSAYLL